MEMAGLALQAIGAILGMVGGIWILVLAFQKSVGWGLACLLIPCVSLVFAIQNWNEAKNPFLIAIGGAVLQVVGIMLMAAGGGGLPQ